MPNRISQHGTANKQHLTVVAVLDFSNAFDTVHFDIPISIMRYLNICPTTINWVCSYLYGRRRRVRIDNNFSPQCNTWVGVSQGSVLSPVLLSIITYLAVMRINKNKYYNHFNFPSVRKNRRPSLRRRILRSTRLHRGCLRVHYPRRPSRYRHRRPATDALPSKNRTVAYQGAGLRQTGVPSLDMGIEEGPPWKACLSRWGESYSCVFKEVGKRRKREVKVEQRCWKMFRRWW